ncbi:unnamed protein product [Ambrosiozyma monospora]|uniref:Unnamed protein product n=1 Tax=Ambrosiozyma monospora TaxID=43982 RepID=A0A9W6YZC3_AMBMO|nr:unnamed protein product [Ambrosiozyma monospora]
MSSPKEEGDYQHVSPLRKSSPIINIKKKLSVPALNFSKTPCLQKPLSSSPPSTVSTPTSSLLSSSFEFQAQELESPIVVPKPQQVSSGPSSTSSGSSSPKTSVTPQSLKQRTTSGGKLGSAGPKPLPMTFNMKIGEELTEIKNTLNDLKYRSKNNNSALVALNENLNKFNEHFRKDEQGHVQLQGQLGQLLASGNIVTTVGATSSIVDGISNGQVYEKLSELESRIAQVSDKLRVLGIESKTSLIKLQELVDEQETGSNYTSLYRSGGNNNSSAGNSSTDSGEVADRVSEIIDTKFKDVKHNLVSIQEQMSAISTLEESIVKTLTRSFQSQLTENLDLTVDKVTAFSLNPNLAPAFDEDMISGLIQKQLADVISRVDDKFQHDAEIKTGMESWKNDQSKSSDNIVKAVKDLKSETKKLLQDQSRQQKEFQFQQQQLQLEYQQKSNEVEKKTAKHLITVDDMKSFNTEVSEKIGSLSSKLLSIEKSIANEKLLVYEDKEKESLIIKSETLQNQLESVKSQLAERRIQFEQVQKSKEELDTQQKLSQTQLINEQDSRRILETQLLDTQTRSNALQSKLSDKTVEAVKLQAENDKLKAELLQKEKDSQTELEKQNKLLEKLQSENEELKKQVEYESGLLTVKYKLKTQVGNLKQVKKQYQSLLLSKENLVNELGYLREIEERAIREKFQVIVNETLKNLNMSGVDGVSNDSSSGGGNIKTKNSKGLLLDMANSVRLADADGENYNDFDSNKENKLVAGISVTKRNFTSRI